MKLLSDPSIALIEQKIKGEDTIAAVGSTSNTSNDGKTDESIKRKQLCSQLSQYCVAKQAASKFQVCNITYEVSIYICLLFTFCIIELCHENGFLTHYYPFT